MRGRWKRRLGLGLASGVATLALLEIGLRLFAPPAVRLFDSAFIGGPGERVVKIDPRFEVHPERGIFQVDAQLGYRPVPGGKNYGTHGCKWNEYVPEKAPGKTRLLFLGDSVTDRGKLQAALRARLGEDAYEYWNGGVTGYNTQQEFAYYRDHLADVAADHVVLTFHLNDYETTPIVFKVDDDLVAVHSKVGGRYPSPWWMAHCYTYRLVWTMLVRSTSAGRAEELEQEVVESMRALRDLVQARHARFTVLILPWLVPRAEWPEPKPRLLEETERTLVELGVAHYGFLYTLARALAAGVEIHEAKVDPQHPSDAFAALMAEDLLSAGFRP
ncbi:MAG: SGNH/GDSL hydrolase family protein [Planctomycetes bacterium]|nr:SGNH/GDSL hydrolase family protein [Planctomycetota bacterium]